jgi:hypothetical protein
VRIITVLVLLAFGCGYAPAGRLDESARPPARLAATFLYLHGDAVGNILKTRSFEILGNGVVIEAYNDFISAGSAHRYGPRRTLTEAELQDIDQVLENAKFNQLPETLSSVGLDSPGRFIRPRHRAGTSHRSN